MANTLWFISHPYKSPPNKDFKGNVCLWNRSSVHHRKLFEIAGASMIDASHKLHTNVDINFIGEWECCSSFVKNSKKGIFDKTHTPILSSHDAGINCINTDPYVFGKEFYWCLCKLSASKIKMIKNGDIVLFGSYTLKNRHVDKIVVDTVLVVEQILLEENIIKRYSLSKCYQDVTVIHVHPYPNCLIIGKMYDPKKDYQSNVPFSFVPCKRKADGLMDKLILDRRIPVPELKGEPLRIGQNGGHLSIGNNIRTWETIVEMVRGAGCDMGVYIPEPVLTKKHAVIDKAAKKFLKSKNSKQKQDEKTNTTCGGGCFGAHC